MTCSLLPNSFKCMLQTLALCSTRQALLHAYWQCVFLSCDGSMLLCRRAETGRSFIFFRYTPFVSACYNLSISVWSPNMSERCCTYEVLDTILCIPGRIRLNGKILVLGEGDLEMRNKRPLSLFRRGDDAPDLQKDGQPAGRLLLMNINNMVSTETAKVEVNLQGDRLTLIAVGPCWQLTYDINAAKPFVAMNFLGIGCKWGEHGVIHTRG